MVLKKFSRKVSWVYLSIRHVFPTEVSPIMTIFISASKVSAMTAHARLLTFVREVRSNKDVGLEAWLV